MSYKLCQNCKKKLVDEVGVCLSCTGIRRLANKAALMQILGVFFGVSYWIFRTWIYGGPFLNLSAKTEVILSIWVFPAIGIMFLIYGGILAISSNTKYDNLKKEELKRKAAGK